MDFCTLFHQAHHSGYTTYLRYRGQGTNDSPLDNGWLIKDASVSAHCCHLEKVNSYYTLAKHVRVIPIPPSLVMSHIPLLSHALFYELKSTLIAVIVIVHKVAIIINVVKLGLYQYNR